MAGLRKRGAKRGQCRCGCRRSVKTHERRRESALRAERKLFIVPEAHDVYRSVLVFSWPGHAATSPLVGQAEQFRDDVPDLWAIVAVAAVERRQSCHSRLSCVFV